jgi:hypothetical protein
MKTVARRLATKSEAIRSVVDIMITILCDFSQFLAKNWRFSQIPMLRSNSFQNLTLFLVKNANVFAKFFGENILKIITSVPVVARGMKRQSV